MSTKLYYALSAKSIKKNDNEVVDEETHNRIFTFFEKKPEEEVLQRELSKYVDELKQLHPDKEIVPMGYWLETSEESLTFDNSFNI